MNWVGKKWYVVASLLYAYFISLEAATPLWCLMYFWFGAFGKTLGDSMATALPGLILGGVGVALIQVLRVRRSLARKVGEPTSLPWWNLDLNLQRKVGVTVFLVPAAGSLLSLPVRWLVIGWGR